MPGTAPVVGYRKVKVNNEFVRITTRDQTNRYAEKFLNQFFNFELETVPLQQDTARDLFGFLCSQNGAVDTFNIQIPKVTENQVPNIDDSTVYATSVGDEAIGQYQMNIQQSAGDTDIIRRGDFLKFANHNKLYQFVADYDDSSELITIYPPLVAAVPQGTQLILNPTATVRLIGETVEQEFMTEGYARLKFDLREEY